MKKISLAFLLLLIAGSLCYAGPMFMQIAGGTNPSGGAAASGYSDPDSDISDGDWGSQDNAAVLDDGIRSPNTVTTNDADRTYAAFDARAALEMAMDNDPTGSVSSLRVYIHGWDRGNTAGIITVQVCGNGGSDCTSATNIDFGDSYYGDWGYAEITGLSWSSAPDVRLLIDRTGDGNFETVYVNACYIEWNP